MSLKISPYFNVAASDHQMEVAQFAESRPSEVAGLASPGFVGIPRIRLKLSRDTGKAIRRAMPSPPGQFCPP